ncbi:hypothetical protein ACIQ4I_19220 [Rummeliibacillus sp. NPDC094406]|uniref:hypothetical protein n=1 Tax=Rummeliibacillus sp. NPDC094406 TaxID=3364511 RepID=UPI003822E038
MNKGFHHLFIGFLFILLDIRFFIDVLPDSLGYFFISKGITEIAQSHKHYSKLYFATCFLIIVAIPLDLNVGITSGFSDYLVFTWRVIWVVYLYYLLSILYSHLVNENYLCLAKSLKSLSNKVPIILLISLFISTFLMNIPHNWAGNLSILIVIVEATVSIWMIVVFNKLSKTKEKKQAIFE